MQGRCQRVARILIKEAIEVSLEGDHIEMHKILIRTLTVAVSATTFGLTTISMKPRSLGATGKSVREA